MSEEKKQCQPQEDKTGEELSNLLDSEHVLKLLYFPLKWSIVGALEDFIDKEKEPQSETKTEDGSSNSSIVVPDSQDWSNDFMQQAVSQFEDRFADFLSGIDPNAQITPELLQERLHQMTGSYFKNIIIMVLRKITNAI